MSPRIDGNYEQLFDTIENKYNPEEMTKGEISKFLGTKTSGREALAEQLSRTKIIYDEIRVAKKRNDLIDLREDIPTLEIHQSRLKIFIDERERVIRRKTLVKKGKTLSILTDDLKQAKTSLEIDSLVSQAESELGPGRNLNSFLIRVEIMRESI